MKHTAERLIGNADGLRPDRLATAEFDVHAHDCPVQHLDGVPEATSSECRRDKSILDILVIDEDLEDRILIHDALRSQVNLSFADGLQDGLRAVSERPCDAVLLDLRLPGHSGLESLLAFRHDHPAVPVVVLAGDNDETLGVEALREGAADYVCTDELSGPTTARTLRFAVERSVMRSELERATLLDEPTGLLNRRGLERSGTAGISRALRHSEPLALICLSFDDGGEPVPNPALRDRQLVRVARMLQATFRQEDFVGRINDTTFCAMLVGHPSASETVARLGATVDRHNERRSESPLLLQLGVAELDHQFPVAFGELFDAAYKQLRLNVAASAELSTRR